MEKWKPIASAPKDASWVEVKMKDGRVLKAHWASNLSGEEQPPFEGWFIDRGSYFAGIATPEEWRPLT